MQHRLITFVLSVLLALGLVACNKYSDNTVNTPLPPSPKPINWLNLK